MRLWLSAFSGFALVAAALVWWWRSTPVETAFEGTSRRLAAGTRLERSLGDGRPHSYSVGLEAGDAFHVVVTQDDADVAVSFFGPRDQVLQRVDGPNGPDGPEALAVVAAEGGDHRLEITAPAGTEGRYRLDVEALGPADERGRRRATAMELYLRSRSRPSHRDAEARRAAIREYRQALDLFRELGEPLLEARTRRYLGELLDREAPGDALDHFERALELYQHSGNDWERAPLFNTAGDAYRRAGESEKARDLFERSIAVSRPLGPHPATAKAYNNLGVLFASFGELQQALVHYDRALAEWRRLGQRANQAKVLHNVGVLYLDLGRLEEGLALLRQALDLHRETEDRGGEAGTLAAIGWAQGLREDYETALETYESALALRRAMGDVAGQSVALDQRGTIYLRMGRHEEALASYQQALDFGEGDPLGVARTRLNLGAAYLEVKRPRAAKEPLERALEVFRKMGAVHGQAASLASLARADRQLEDRAAALRRLETALGLVESVRSRLQSRWLRSSYLAVRHDEYSAYVDLLMELETEEPGAGHAVRALEASERARARTLLESLEEARAGVRAAAPPELLSHERTLRARINATERRRMELLAEGSEATAKTLEQELRGWLREYEEVEGEIRARSPLAPDGSSLLSLDGIRREVLDEETLLLVYALGPERSFLWIVGRDELTSHELAPRSEIEDLARRVHALMPRSHVPGLRRQASAASGDLSRALLGPAAGQLGDERLLIVVDGALHFVPIGALPAPSEGDEAERPLLADHEIVYLPSASVLAVLRRDLAGRPRAPGVLAVVADPVYQEDDPRLSEPGETPDRDEDTALEGLTRDFGSRFERLPFAGLEADAILALVSEKDSFRAVGFEASRDLVLSGKLDGHRIVHIATHGLLDARHPALTGLALSFLDETGRPRDGMLRVHEIFDLRLSADLVVLSACRSALGKEVRGEGLMGLAHGFFYAGAARLVVSYWNVNDRATAELMTRFYRGMLRDGLPPAAALREAQLSMLREREWQAPYYWAGFAQHGEWR